MPRKRARDETELDLSLIQSYETPREPGLLARLRSMWQLACFNQYMCFFGQIVKIDESIDMDELEEICLSPDKVGKLAEIGLTLLKYVSSHRGLTPEIFDEYTRRQYIAKAPQSNPFGDEEEPARFKDFDIFTKIKVLHQLSAWTLGNVDRFRSLMPEKDSEQIEWRIEPFGWDSEDRTYFMLDDDRLYRRTDPPIPSTPVKVKRPAKAKSNPKPRAKGTRASKRIRLSSPPTDSEAPEDAVAEEANDDTETQEEPLENDFGGMKWECIAVTMDQFQDFLESIRKSRDPNEKTLHKNIVDNVIPLLEKRAERQRQKILRRQRELENLERMATAKRSSRLADKHEKQREAEENAAAERKRIADLEMARKEQLRQQKLEEARESRMQTREQRLKEREVKRILHEEELAKLEQLKVQGLNSDSRHSSRQLESELERRQRAIDAYKEEEEKWVFDCAGCGLHGENVDDGAHSLACERCNIWQHSKCNGIDEADAERDDFHFVCSDCKRKEEDSKKPKIPPLKLGRIGASASPQAEKAPPSIKAEPNSVQIPTEPIRIVEGVSILNGLPAGKEATNVLGGPLLSPHTQPLASSPAPTSVQPVVGVPQLPWTGNPLPPPMRSASPSSVTQSGAEHKQSPQPSAYQIHQAAHARAVSASGLQSPTFLPKANGYANGSSPQRASQAPRQAPPQSSFMTSFQSQQTSPKPNGVHISPVKKQQTPSPMSVRQADRSSPFPLLSSSKGGDQQYHNLSPPPNSAQQQRIAGQSPIKQVSPSPRGAPYTSLPPQSSPVLYPPIATPTAQVVPPLSSPSTSFMRATPQAASSPIPPIGSGPVIPQKHDPSNRPPSQDNAGEVPVFPPTTSLSPSRLQDGRGMDVRPGEGGLGTGGIPVKKLPEQLTSPIVPQLSSPPPMQSMPHLDAIQTQKPVVAGDQERSAER